MRISYSSLDTYSSCPLKYKFQEVDKIKTPKSKEAIFGTTLHSTLKFIHAPGILYPNLEQALEFFSQNWNPAIFDSPEEERSAFSQGIRILQDYYQKNNPAEVNVIDLESRFQVEIGNQENRHLLSGIIDRIDKTQEGYEIIDYKTNRKMPSQEKVDNDVQLSIYLRAFLSRYPQEERNLDKIKVSLYYLKHGVKLTSKRTKEQLKKSEASFLETIRLIESGKFEPTPSPLCDWCGYQKLCPLWKHKFKELRKFETEIIKKLIEEYIELKSAISLTKERLEKIQEDLLRYMQQEGVTRIFGEKGSLTKILRKTYKYDKTRLKEILDPLEKWDLVTKVDGLALKNILDSLSEENKREVEKAKIIDKESVGLTVKK